MRISKYNLNKKGIIFLLFLCISSMIVPVKAIAGLEGPADFQHVQGVVGSIEWTVYPFESGEIWYTIGIVDGDPNLKSGNYIGQSGFPFPLSYDDISQLDLGTYTFICTLHNEDGTVVYASDTVVVEVLADNTPPTIEDVQDVSKEEPLYDFIIAWWVEDNIALDRYELRENGIIFEEGLVEGHVIQHMRYVFYAGIYVFNCTVFDTAGNSASDEFTLTVTPDVTQPYISHAPDVERLVGYDEFSIHWTAYDNSEFGIDYYEATIDEEPTQVIWQGGINFYIRVPTYLPIGEHTITISVYDFRDNKASDTVIFTVLPDTEKPIISELEDVFMPVGTQEELVWTITDNTGGTYEINVEDVTIETGDWNLLAIRSFDLSTLEVGVYTIEIVVTDFGGNTEIDSVLVSVLNDLYWVFEPTDQEIFIGDSLNYQIAVKALYNVKEWIVNDTCNFEISTSYYLGGSSITIKNIIDIPGEYGLEISVIDGKDKVLTTIIMISILEPVTQPQLKLSGSFDYLEKEEIHLQIAGILTDGQTGSIISGATVTFEIYNPDGELIISGILIETNPGIYVYKAEDTIKNLKGTFAKGIYWVYAHAITENGLEAVDMIQFHIDPPGEVPISISTWMIPLVIGVIALLGGSVGGFYLKKRRF